MSSQNNVCALLLSCIALSKAPESESMSPGLKIIEAGHSERAEKFVAPRNKLGIERY